MLRHLTPCHPRGRRKEHAHDSRDFPAPDLLPLVFDLNWVSEIEATLPELPDEKRACFSKDYGLSDYLGRSADRRSATLGRGVCAAAERVNHFGKVWRR